MCRLPATAIVILLTAALWLPGCARKDASPSSLPGERRYGDVTGYADEVISRTNAERQKVGLRMLDKDSGLMAATALRAQEIERVFEHTRPDGRPYYTVLSEFQVKSYNRWAENIIYSTGGTPAEAMEWWMNSPGHRVNILNKDYTHIGVGVHQSKGQTYFVQLFIGRPEEEERR